MPELEWPVDAVPRSARASLPAVGRLMDDAAVQHAARGTARNILRRLVRNALADERARLAAEGAPADFAAVRGRVLRDLARVGSPSLRPVINATGIVLHTNLGRAPMSAATVEAVIRAARGYSNLELDLETGKRGNRQAHLQALLRLLTGAEDTLVVNNNAAAILLVSRALACRREIVISRGELVEIGDSFRLGDIMQAGGARLVEVGATNRTRLGDYAGAVGPRTALLFKAHTSNFKTIGFCAQVSLAALASYARGHGVPCVYDLGSGMLRRPPGLPVDDEPSLDEAIAGGADLVLASGDKLLGGPQAGLIAGRRELIGRLAKCPILRALRPGRLIIAALEAVAREHLDEGQWLAGNQVYRMLRRTPAELRAQADQLASLLARRGVTAELVASQGQVGGGALPGVALAGWAVRVGTKSTVAASSGTPSQLFRALLRGVPPVLAVLRDGQVLLDVRTVAPEDMEPLAETVKDAAGCLRP